MPLPSKSPYMYPAGLVFGSSPGSRRITSTALAQDVSNSGHWPSAPVQKVPTAWKEFVEAYRKPIIVGKADRGEGKDTITVQQAHADATYKFIVEAPRASTAVAAQAATHPAGKPRHGQQPSTCMAIRRSPACFLEGQNHKTQWTQGQGCRVGRLATLNKQSKGFSLARALPGPPSTRLASTYPPPRTAPESELAALVPKVDLISTASS
ncbi:hypothetical protein WJX74_004920 [Apatococcus lobatus]|uniref:Uncharacterized protein n=1 Tax=Apatococcus lobatus TaxID=904363 RepID=A0AAW1R2A4_9CHLO